ncbi:hypothetical protein PoB_004190600 [Plakobranchus ocellatus]|uniref:Uncharacterized protein n=1 Tax=Plakobranchus ocellatus TaxID=259542 RepID=A0AAV4AWB3_9GAST|nr:hypothetical protein PoB_004190600 [Plakobranchus ocellatus]
MGAPCNISKPFLSTRALQYSLVFPQLSSWQHGEHPAVFASLSSVLGLCSTRKSSLSFRAGNIGAPCSIRKPFLSTRVLQYSQVFPQLSSWQHRSTLQYSQAFPQYSGSTVLARLPSSSRTSNIVSARQYSQALPSVFGLDARLEP